MLADDSLIMTADDSLPETADDSMTALPMTADYSVILFDLNHYFIGQ